jgi:hypothetical protein
MGDAGKPRLNCARAAVAAAIALAIAIALGFVIGTVSSSSSTTSTVAAPALLTAPPAAPARVTAQKRACPSTTTVEPKGAPEPPASPDCTATLSPEQLKGAIIPPPSIVDGSTGDPPNGQYPPSALAPATGCSRGLAKDAAAAWNHVAVVVHDHTGYWLQSNGDASCYRTLAQQVELRNYWCGQGNCSNAAVPSTSNHGWGLAVDAPPQTVADIHRYAGGLFGQGYGSCSDAPWEGWHVKYCGGYSGPDPGPYGKRPAPPFVTLQRGDHGPRVRTLSTRLALLRRPTPAHPAYIAWKRRSSHYSKAIAFGVRRLQRDCNLGADGVYGQHTDRCLVKRWKARG